MGAASQRITSLYPFVPPSVSLRAFSVDLRVIFPILQKPQIPRMTQYHFCEICVLNLCYL